MEYKIATEKDIDELMNIRLEMLRIVNEMDENQTFTEELISCSKRYFLEGNQVTCLVFDGNATLRFMKQQELVDYAVKWIEANRK